MIWMLFVSSKADYVSENHGEKREGSLQVEEDRFFYRAIKSICCALSIHNNLLVRTELTWVDCFTLAQQ